MFKFTQFDCSGFPCEVTNLIDLPFRDYFVAGAVNYEERHFHFSCRLVQRLNCRIIEQIVFYWIRHRDRRFKERR